MASRTLPDYDPSWEALPRTRSEARLLGLNRYFTRKPCKNGHIFLRKTSCKSCLLCMKSHIHNWRVTNKARVNEAAKIRRSLDIEKARKYARENRSRWGKTAKGRERNAIDCRNAYARRQGAEGKYTEADVSDIRKLQKDMCAYCRVRLNGKGQVDHIIAISVGGTNYRNNLQLLCLSCNASKNARDPIDYARSIGRLI